MYGPGWPWRPWRSQRRFELPFLLHDPYGSELLAAPAALGFGFGFGFGGPDRRTVALQMVRSRQDQAVARATARFAGGPQFHPHLITQLGVGQLLGLVSGPQESACSRVFQGKLPAPWSG